jgi:hypothetical protein
LIRRSKKISFLSFWHIAATFAAHCAVLGVASLSASMVALLGPWPGRSAPREGRGEAALGRSVPGRPGKAGAEAGSDGGELLEMCGHGKRGGATGLRPRPLLFLSSSVPSQRRHLSQPRCPPWAPSRRDPSLSMDDDDLDPTSPLNLDRISAVWRWSTRGRDVEKRRQ